MVYQVEKISPVKDFRTSAKKKPRHRDSPSVSGLPSQMFFFFISPLEHLYWKNHADIVFFKGLNDQPGRRRRSGKYDERGGQDSGAVRGEEGKRNAGDYGDTGVGWRMA